MDLKKLKDGDRVILLAPLTNPNSKIIAEEKIPVGTRGTVYGSWSPGVYSPTVSVQWDNGSTLGIFEHDDVELVMNEDK